MQQQDVKTEPDPLEPAREAGLKPRMVEAMETSLVLWRFGEPCGPTATAKAAGCTLNFAQSALSQAARLGLLARSGPPTKRVYDWTPAVGGSE